MSAQVEHGLNWCIALYAKGFTAQALAIMNTAIASHQGDTRRELQDAWDAFLVTV
jgi:hypothetical protein